MCQKSKLSKSLRFQQTPSCTWHNWTATTHHSRFCNAKHIATELIRPKSGALCHLVCHISVCMRPEFMTSMSCDSVYCMCGVAWSSRWLMMQLTNAKHPCVLVFVPEAEILNILCDYQFVFSVLDELYVSHHAWSSRSCSKSTLYKYEMWCLLFTR